MALCNPLTPSGGVRGGTETTRIAPVRKSMPLSTADLNRLSRLVEGWMDADVRLAADAGALLEAVDTARRSLNEGGGQAARQHIERFVHLTEALVQSDMLTPAEGRAVTIATDRILDLEKDAGDGAG